MKKHLRGWSIVEEDDDPLNFERRRAVKDAMIHAWTYYEMYAWGHDELKVCLLVMLHVPHLLAYSAGPLCFAY